MKKTSMPKKVKRFLSAAISLSIIATNFAAMTAQAEGETSSSLFGNYPTHPTENNKAYYGYGDTGLSASDSDTAASLRKFTVGGIEYLLLDQDENGNYFILQNNSVTNAAAYYSGGSSQTDENLDEWRYNYSDSKSIAYYLDNTYRNNMPESIKSHLIRYDWNVEGDWPRGANENSDWFKNKVANNPPEVQSGYVALMSATEFNTYKDIIGVANVPSTGWQGILLRTRFSNGANYAPLLSEYYKDNNGNISMGQSDIKLTNYYIRPCFWVDANFFADAKVTGYENSTIVKQVLKEQGYAKLNSAGYTDAEIEALGITDKNWYGLYPTHSTKNDKAYYGASGSTAVSAAASNAKAAERTFTVGGKNYILLDKNSDGQYFVVENQKSNGKAYYSGNITADSDGKDEWAFDYTNENSIAYYLENSYRLDNTKMPEIIRNKLVKKSWTIEGDFPDGALTDKTWTANKIKNNQPYSQDAYVSIMSATEFNVYKGVIGTADLTEQDSNGWTGVMLRTPLTNTSVSQSNEHAYSVLPPSYVYRDKDSAGNVLNNIVWGRILPNNTGYYIRPCFWLEKDFFADVHVDNAGEFVTAEILNNYDYLDLIGTYTNEEIRSMGIEVTTKPSGISPSVSNLAVKNVGNNIEVQYTFDKGLPSEYNNREHISSAFGDNSTFVWYICASDGSNKQPIADANKSTLTVTANESGKYICVEVTPANGLGDTGAVQSLVYFVTEGTNELKINGVRLKNQKDEEILDINGVKAATGLTLSVDIENLTEAQKDVMLILSVYGSNNELIGIQYTDVQSVSVKADSVENSGTLTLTTPTLSIANDDAKTVKIMLWNNFVEARPYIKAKPIQ